MWGHPGSWPKDLLEKRPQQWKIVNKCLRAEERVPVTPKNRDTLLGDKDTARMPIRELINCQGKHPKRWRANFRQLAGLERWGQLMTIPAEGILFLVFLFFPPHRPVLEGLEESQQDHHPVLHSCLQPTGAHWGRRQGLTSYQVQSFDCSRGADMSIAEWSQYLLLKMTLGLPLS